MIEHTETYGRVDITLEILPEDYPPDWLEPSEVKEFYQKVDNGELLYFIAKVTVWMDDIALADDYLGGCVYNSIDDFLKCEYYDDIKRLALESAKAKTFELLRDSQEQLQRILDE